MTIRLTLCDANVTQQTPSIYAKRNRILILGGRITVIVERLSLAFVFYRRMSDGRIFSR